MDDLKGIYAVAFLDIVGYKDIVNNNYMDTNEIERIRKAFEYAINFIGGYKSKSLGDPVAETIIKVTNIIKIRVLSDSIILSMPMFSVEEIKALSAAAQNLGIQDRLEIPRIIYLFIFLLAVSTFIVILSGELGYFLRGGLSIGQHLEEKINTPNDPDNLFIFSKAMVSAYELEKKASYFRVVVDEGFYDFIFKSKFADKFNQLKEMFYNDIDFKCVDIYEFISTIPSGKESLFLPKIITALKRQINKNRNNPDIIEKYDKYIIYHNKKMNKLNLNNYIIDPLIIKK